MVRSPRLIARMFKNTGLYALGDFLIKLTTAIFAPIYTVLLAPAEYGIWSMATMVITGLAYVYNPALHGAVTRFFYDHEDDDIAKRPFRTLFSFLLVWSLAMSAILWLAGPWLFAHLFVDLPFRPYGQFIIAIAFINILNVVPKAAWAAGEEAIPFVTTKSLGRSDQRIRRPGPRSSRRYGCDGTLWARLASLILVAWPYILYLSRRVGFAWNTRDFRSAMAFSLPLVPHLLSHWVLAMADRMILERMLGIAAVGIYGSAYVFTEVVNTVAISMNRAWVPLFTRNYGDESPETRALIGRSITYFLVWSPPSQWREQSLHRRS